MDSRLGKLGKDKITGFEGIIVGKIEYLFGCDHLGLAPRTFNKEGGKRPDTEWFDDGRIEIIGDGIIAEKVSGDKPGADFNFDTPR
jgi:hypothetical protein